MIITSKRPEPNLPWQGWSRDGKSIVTENKFRICTKGQGAKAFGS